MTHQIITKNPWFKNGLRFKCTECAKCCSGPGYVCLSSHDITALSQHLHLSEKEFLATYTQNVSGQYHLKDTPSENCIFLEHQKCRVYAARPTQCRTFPWWLSTLDSPQSWEEAKNRCEGIDHPEAPLVAEAEIASQCMTYLDNLIEQNFQFEYK